MCIIVYKPAGQEMPSKDILRECFLSNSDGAGFMYPLPNKKKVLVRKGFMNLADLERALRRIPNVEDVPVVIHFRIGTQGPNDKTMTHPFPITDNEESLMATNVITDVALAHNGIISQTSSYSYFSYGVGDTKDKLKDLHSDTFYFVRDYAHLIVNGHYRYHEDERSLKLLERIADSKLAIMGGDSHVELIGSFIHDNGLYYSNSSYRPVTCSSITKYGSATRYSDDDTYPTIGEVSAEFVPDTVFNLDGSESALMILDEETGKMYCPWESAFVYDTHGTVYLYDDLKNGLVEDRTLTVVDDKFEYRTANYGSSVKYRVIEDDGNTKGMGNDCIPF